MSVLPLFPGSGIRTPKAYDHFKEAIDAEIRDMGDLVALVSEDASYKGTPQTKMAVHQSLMMIRGYQASSATPDMDRALASHLLGTIRQLISDDTTRFTEGATYGRMLKMVRRTEPQITAVTSENEMSL